MTALGDKMMTVQLEISDLTLEDVHDAAKLLAAWVDRLERTPFDRWPQPLAVHTEAAEELVWLARAVVKASGLVFDGTVSDEDSDESV